MLTYRSIHLSIEYRHFVFVTTMNRQINYIHLSINYKPPLLRCKTKYPYTVNRCFPTNTANSFDWFCSLEASRLRLLISNNMQSTNQLPILTTPMTILHLYVAHCSVWLMLRISAKLRVSGQHKKIPVGLRYRPLSIYNRHRLSNNLVW